MLPNRAEEEVQSGEMVRLGSDGVLCAELLEGTSKPSLAFHLQRWEEDYRTGCAFLGKDPRPERGWRTGERLCCPRAPGLQEVERDALRLRKWVSEKQSMGDCQQ